MAIAAPFPAVGTDRRIGTRPARSTTRPARDERSARTSTGFRLTTRGRAVVLLVSTAFLLLVVLLSTRVTADAGSSLASQGQATQVVVVQQGESLWQIAQQIAPNTDPRETVTLIRDLNGLGDSTVVAGQSVVVPL